MAVKELDWEFSRRGQEDVARHQKKIKQSIRENISDVIAEEAIITRRKGQTVKVPIKGIKSYQFTHGRRKGQNGGGYGLGHGKNKKGDVIGRRFIPGQGQGQPGQPGKEGQAGDMKGEDYLETEIEIEELIAMMMDDLQLPDLRKKEIAETAIPVGWTMEDVEKHGLKSNLDKRRTLKESLKRGSDWVQQLARETGKPMELCQKAYNKAKGNYGKAKKILTGVTETEASEELEQASDKLRPHLINDDLRFRVVREDVEFHSNAVILAMMDVSGSMTSTKKYLARSFFFWMVEFLKHKYRNVEIRFIAHTTEAKLVDENEFFHKGESGGTMCYSAYDLAANLIDSEYPPSRWNIYAYHFSDGEDWDPGKTMQSVRKLLEKKINMLGYGEIHTDPAYGQQLLKSFEEAFNLERHTSYIDSNFEYYSPRGSAPMVGTVLRNKGHVYPALRVFFSRERKV